VLAHAGLGSRRACEELILKGRVTINGKVVRELGSKVDLRKATLAVDGEKIHIEPHVYYAVYKPKGYVSTNNDPSGRPRVLDLLPEIPQRVYTVGRLDEMSNGLILLTNDGNLAHQLAHPKYGVEKLYRVVVAGLPSQEVLKQLTDGIWLAEGKVRAKKVRAVGKRGESTILEMVLSEGKNREVRRMLAKLGHKVMSLTRIAVGPITIKGLTAGHYRSLTSREVGLLRKAAAGEYIAPFGPDRARDSDRKRDARPRLLQPSPGAGSGSEGRRPHGPALRPPGPGMRPTGPASRRPFDAGPRSPGTGMRPPGPASRRPSGPPPRPEGPGARPGPASRRPSGQPPRPEGPGARPGPASRRPSGQPPRPEGPGARPLGPASRRPSGPPPRPEGPGGRPLGPAARRPGSAPSPGGPARGPGPRPPGPVQGSGSRPNLRIHDEDRLISPVGEGNDFHAPSRGRRVIGLEQEAPPPRPASGPPGRPRPTGKRPLPKSRPPRKAPGPLKRRPRRGDKE
jgi:23S rRNA pseudouridine2605 synthase